MSMMITHEHTKPPPNTGFETIHFGHDYIEEYDRHNANQSGAGSDGTRRHLRTDEPIWIRVTDETRRHIFEYSFSL